MRVGEGVKGGREESMIFWDEIQVRKGGETYLFLFVALLAQIFTSSGHLSAAHGVLFGSKMFFRLRFCRIMVSF